MKRTLSTLLALGMIVAMTAVFAVSASAQTDGPMGQVTVVNGTTNKVDVSTTGADGTPVDLGKGLTQGGVGTPTVLEPGDYTITFVDAGDGSPVATYQLTLGPVEAWNVVSGFGDEANATNAKGYEVKMDATPPVAAVANSSEVDVTVTPPGADLPQGGFVAQPDMSPITITTPAGSSVTEDLSGAPGTSFNFVVAVGTDDALASAVVTIADLGQLKTDLEGTTPPTTLPPSDVTVPNVVGAPEGDATAALEAEGLAAAVTQAPSEDVVAGNVISQDPAADATVAPGSTVNIVVSTGPDAPAKVTVPDTIGQPVDDATAAIEAEGLVADVQEIESEGTEPGVVIESDPAAGTEVDAGSTVVLTVAAEAGQVTVPDFIGMTTDEATKASEEAGLTIRFVENEANPDPNGIVVSQDPSAGAMVDEGTEVVANLSPAFEEAWTILVVDQNRELTVTGINFQINSTTTSSVINTTISQTAPVGTSGSWSTKIDISSLGGSEQFLKVTGTAADGSAYEQTFKVPAAGESSDQPVPDTTSGGGFPWWGWAIIGVVVVTGVVAGVTAINNSKKDNDSSPQA